MQFTLRTFLRALLAVAAALLLYEGSTGQLSQRRAVTVHINKTAILPLNLGTTLDVAGVKVEWKRDKEYVHVFQINRPYLEYQGKAFKNRAFLFEDQISKGNVSLKLINVTEQDAGNYTCIILDDNMPKDGKKFEFYLEIARDSPKKAPTEAPKTDPLPTAVQISGSVGGAVALGLVILVVCCRKNRNNQNNQAEMHNDHNLNDPRNLDDQNNRDIPNNPVELNEQYNPNQQDGHNNPDDRDSQEDQINGDNQDARDDQDNLENKNGHDEMQINEDKNANEGSSLLKDATERN